MTSTEVITVTYTQSDVPFQITPADYTGMNNGTADGAGSNNQTATIHDGWIQADLGTPQAVNGVVLGYDFHQNLPGDFGPATYNGATLAGSTDEQNWTTLGTCDAGATTNGLQTIPVGGATYRYLRVAAAPTQALAITEFEVWGGTAAGVMPPSAPQPPAQLGAPSGAPTDQFIAAFDLNEAARQAAVAQQREALIATSPLRAL
jgi:hypothetical protein